MINLEKTLRISLAYLLSAAALVLGTSAIAQDEVETAYDGFKKITAQERAEALATVDDPLSANDILAVTRRKVDKKLIAARVLGDSALTEKIYREAIVLLPDSYLRNNLANSLIAKGEFKEANLLRSAAIASSENPIGNLISKANQAKDYYTQFRDLEAAVIVDSVFKEVSILERSTIYNSDKNTLQRALSINNSTLSLIKERAGKYSESIALAEESERAALKAYALLDKSSGAFIKQITAGALATAVQRALSSNRAAGKFTAANLALSRYLRLAKEEELGNHVHARIYLRAGDLRFQEKNYLAAISFYEKSDALYKSTLMEEEHRTRTGILRSLSQVLIGAKKYEAALATFTKLDELAGASSDAKVKPQVRYRLERGISYVFNKKYFEAATEFKSLAATYATRHGTNHYFTLNVQGLQGAALWRGGKEENKTEAFALLSASVQSMLDPANAEYLENIGIRKELRDLIIDAYIDASGQSGPTGGLEALGIADWRNGGLVQEALSDAALRSAAASPALQALVRSEQDARNEIRGLRSYLAGEAGGAASPLPAIAAQMRERISALETQRTAWQGKIKASFPDYERLVRPTPPSVADITAQLGADEALLVVQPTERATYVWALAKDRPGAFARVEVGEAQVADWVKALRASLDVAALPPGRRPPFAHSAAQQLYAQLVAPAQAVLQGKPQLIVAAGGALGQIPFAVLQTQSGANSTTPLANAPWLVKQAAISHVPSVAAWLAMRTSAANPSSAASPSSAAAQRRSAEQPLMAWGDPVFNLKSHLQNTQNNTKISDADTGKLATQSIVAKDPQGNDTTVRQVSLTRANTAVDLETEDPRSALRYSDIPALPETRGELLAIAKELGANPATDLLLGTSATRQSVLAANASGLLGQKRVIAFATHGLMAGDLPNLTQPALALAASSTDGTATLAPLLLLEDVLGLKLNADWVVLSACNTAAADGKAEEALSGLARGFFYAGGRSLLVTHWAVESDSATQITTETFKHYAANPTAPKAESLRHAMLKLINSPQTSHPALWAPYALVGDGAR
jgi:CHAT domain-containing protein